MTVVEIDFDMPGLDVPAELVEGKARPSVTERFNAKWQVEDESDPTSCWVWTGAMDGHGYGSFGVFGVSPFVKGMSAHRFAYEFWCGPIPPGADVHHLCGKRLCIRPDHLQAMTRRDHKRAHRKPHCKWGHELAGENLYTNPSGHRKCRACARETLRKHHAENRDEINARRRAKRAEAKRA